MRQTLFAGLAFIAVAAWADTGVPTSLVQGDEDRAVLRAFLAPAQLDSLRPEQRSELARAVQDPSWPRRAALLEAAAIQPSAMPPAARADAARQFRDGRSRDRLVFTQAPGAVPTTAQADVERAFRTAQQMVMDPDAFEKSRPDLYPSGSS